MIIEVAFTIPLYCMALNIPRSQESIHAWTEAGVMVMNRVNDDRFPDNVCDVVTEAVTYKGTINLYCTSASSVGIVMGKEMSLKWIVKSGGMQKSTHLLFYRVRLLLI